MAQLALTSLSQLLADLRLNGGGTFDLHTLQPVAPADGYAVSLAGHEVRCALDALTPALAQAYLEQHDGPDAYLGTWIDEQVVYFDLSEIIADYTEAVVRATMHQQQSIYAFRTRQVIDVATAMQGVVVAYATATEPRRDTAGHRPQWP